MLHPAVNNKDKNPRLLKKRAYFYRVKLLAKNQNNL